MLIDFIKFKDGILFIWDHQAHAFVEKLFDRKFCFFEIYVTILTSFLITITEGVSSYRKPYLFAVLLELPNW